MNTTPLVLFVLFSFCALTCKKNPVGPPSDLSFALTVNDVSCTEAWLTLHVGSGFATHTAKLTRDTVVVANIKLIGTDTTIGDTGLSPSHTYTYMLSLPGATSATTKATTMDTTSHALTWTMYTLGDGSGSSSLFDVAIISDTLAYAVGEIFNGGTAYNFAKWDGQVWSTTQILYPYQGQQYFAQLLSIFIFSENDLWVGSNQPMHWNGTSWQTFDLSASIWNGWIYKIWGSSSSNLYIVGGGGSIAHFNGTSWTQITSGTSISF